jgi:hypothetical protein
LDALLMLSRAAELEAVKINNQNKVEWDKKFIPLHAYL